MLTLLFTLIFTLYFWNHVSATDCGKFFPPEKRPTGRIVDGFRAYAGLFPWMVSLQVKEDNEYRHICGGAIISEDWILTAAHCVEDQNAPIERINAGSLVWNHSISLHTPSKIIIHSSSRTNSDLAVVKVTPSFIFKEGDDGEGAVEPVCLPQYEEQFSGRVTASGWGSTTDSGQGPEYGKYPRELYAVNVPILADEICQQYSNYFSSGPYLCTGPAKRGNQQGTCFGDSGGPLIGIIKKRAYLVGIISGANAAPQLCGDDENPPVYSKISTFRKWIKINTNI